MEKLLEKLYDNHMPIRLQVGYKEPISNEKVAAGNQYRCSLALWLKHDGNFGIRTGEVSNGFEVIDFDPKNYGDSTEDKEEIKRRSPILMKEYTDLIKEQDGDDLLKRVVALETPSGGYHFYFRSKYCGKNSKLARREGDGAAFIETRGDGGYVATTPSEGYTVVRGDIFNIPTISEEERELLMSTARALNLFFDDKSHEYEYKEASTRYDSPWVAANLDGDTYLDEIISDGWIVSGHKGSATLLRRPGKEKGHSAMFNPDPTKGKYPFFWSFTTSATLGSDKRYSHTDYLLELRFGGDKRRMAEELVRRGYGVDKYRQKPQAQHVPADLSTEAEEFKEEVLGFEIRHDTDIPKEEPIIWMNGEIFLTRGNLSGVAGVQKTGKSALSNVIMSKMINQDCNDFNSIKVTPPKGKGLIYIDTEQSRYKQQKNLKNWMMRRAGTTEQPDNLHYYNFRQFTIHQSKDYLSQVMKMVHEKHAGIHLVIIDGAADFMTTVNNLEEVTEFMKLLSELCSVYDCGILVNIHTNPSSVHTGDHKPTGHLGSHLLKKCESVIVIQQDQNQKDVSVVEAIALREASKADFGEILYKYDKEKGYHMELEKNEVKEVEKDNQHLEILKQVANLSAGQKKNDAILDCMNTFEWSFDVGKKKINEAIKLKFLTIENEILKKRGDINKKDDNYPDKGAMPF